MLLHSSFHLGCMLAAALRHDGGAQVKPKLVCCTSGLSATDRLLVVPLIGIGATGASLCVSVAKSMLTDGAMLLRVEWRSTFTCADYTHVDRACGNGECKVEKLISRSLIPHSHCAGTAAIRQSFPSRLLLSRTLATVAVTCEYGPCQKPASSASPPAICPHYSHNSALTLYIKACRRTDGAQTTFA